MTNCKRNSFRKVAMASYPSSCFKCYHVMCQKQFSVSRIDDGNRHTRMWSVLDIIELLSKYDKTLKELISDHKKVAVNYLSPQIQNEFINLLGQKVRNEILSRIRKSKYYSLLFDCTPDASHNEQLTEIIRYVYIDNGKVSIEKVSLTSFARKKNWQRIGI